MKSTACSDLACSKCKNNWVIYKKLSGRNTQGGYGVTHNWAEKCTKGGGETEMQIVSAPRHEVPSRFGDQH